MGDRTKFAEGKMAAARAEAYRVHDPFPTVPHALLASAEIRDYIRITGMVDGFKESNLKSASYEVFAGGDFIYWDGKKKIKKLIDRNKQQFVTLPPNSITFMQVDSTFRLPDYIAVRFNLRITHVHRGLLLGTGPLVDPGFVGKLLIPVHNLTASEYNLDLSKALIWVEFTKTTAHYKGFYFDPHFHRNENSGNEGEDDSRGFVAFPRDKSELKSEEYLFKANQGRPIVSSIPDALKMANDDAKTAKDSVDSIQKWARSIGVLAVLGAILGITAAITNAWSLVQTANTAVLNADRTMSDLKGEVKVKSDVAFQRSESLFQSVDDLKRRPTLDANEINALRQRLAELERLLKDLQSAPKKEQPRARSAIPPSKGRPARRANAP